MGLMVHSLGELPLEVERSYYIYVLDYGWSEPLGAVLRENFGKMADMASKNDAIVLCGTVGSHFHDEVMSWHGVNGQPSEEVLPSILITTRHPRQFEHEGNGRRVRDRSNDRLLLIPLRKACKNTTDVMDLINRIFIDVRSKKALSGFEIAKMLHQGIAGAIVDALILQPSVGGMGLDLKKIVSFFRRV